jgi:hypothetical protein
MNSFLQLIQNTDFADWVRVSEWGYPIILTLHSLGLAMVVGVVFVMDLRILGVPRALPVLALRQLMPVIWVGFTINFITGLALFSADADKFYHSPVFRYKLASVAVGVALAVYMNASVLKSGKSFDRDGAAMPLRAKLLACASVLVWLAAISLGRYVAYE